MLQVKSFHHPKRPTNNPAKIQIASMRCQLTLWVLGNITFLIVYCSDNESVIDIRRKSLLLEFRSHIREFANVESIEVALDTVWIVNNHWGSKCWVKKSIIPIVFRIKGKGVHNIA